MVMAPVSSLDHSGLGRVVPSSAGFPGLPLPGPTGGPILVGRAGKVFQVLGISVKVRLFHELEGDVGPVLLDTGRVLEELIAVNCDVVSVRVGKLVHVNDSASESFPLRLG